MALDQTSKIYVAGHHGLVGSAIWNNLLQRGYTNLVGRSHREMRSSRMLWFWLLLLWVVSWQTHSIGLTSS